MVSKENLSLNTRIIHDNFQINQFKYTIKANFSGNEKCLSLGIVLHETMHALGFLHEHMRPDRSNYVRVNRANIIPGGVYLSFLPFISAISYQAQKSLIK